MISQLSKNITEAQINSIVEIIIKQYADYNRLINTKSFKSVFSDEYAPHNRQFSVSWAISSGFPSHSNACEGFEIERLTYSRNFTRPLLYNDSIIIMILNKTTHFNSDYLQEYYRLNNSQNNQRQLFAFFMFSVDNKQLTKISLCFPNADGVIIAEELLLNKMQIIQRIAA